LKRLVCAAEVLGGLEQPLQPGMAPSPLDELAD
jgi:hypothetical protein